MATESFEFPEEQAGATTNGAGDFSAPSSSSDEWALPEETNTEAPLSVDAYKQEVSQLLDSEDFWQKPFADKVNSLRNVYLGPEQNGARDWGKDEDAIVGLHKEFLAAAREHDGIPNVDPKDYINLIGGSPPDVSTMPREQAFEELDKWEATALAHGRMNGGLLWKEIEDSAEKQIADEVDAAKAYYNQVPAGAPRYQYFAGVLDQAVGAAASGFGAPILKAVGATDTARALERTMAVDFPRPKDRVELNIPGTNIAIEGGDLAEAVGGLAGFAGQTALVPEAGIPRAIGVTALMSVAALSSYRDGYEQVMQKTGSEKDAISNGLAQAGIQTVSAMFEYGIVKKIFSPGSKAISEATKIKAVATAIEKNGYGPALKTGLKIAGKTGDIIGSAATMGVVVREQTDLGGEAASRFANDPTLRKSSQELNTMTAAGVIMGGVAGAQHAAGDVRPSIPIEGTPTSDRIVTEGLKQGESIAAEAGIPKEAEAAPVGQEPVAPPVEPVPVEPLPVAPPIKSEPDSRPTVGQEKNTGVFETLSGKKIPYTQERIPLEELVVQKDIPNFKRGADPKTGVVGGDEVLPRKFEEIQAGPVAVLEKDVTAGGEKEVSSGRNRFRIAQLDPEQKDIPAIVIKESQGFTIEDAKTLDAELNIRDNQGTTQDFAKFFERNPMTEQVARERGLLRGPAVEGEDSRQARGFKIGTQATPEVQSAYHSGVITEKAAARIAAAAPGDSALQRAGLTEVLKGESPETATKVMNIVENQKELGGSEGAQQDMFGGNDQAMRDVGRLANAATELQKEAREAIRQLEAAQRASKIPDTEKLPGIEGRVKITSPEELKAAIDRLKDETKDLEGKGWLKNPELVSRVQERAKEQLTKGEQLSIDLARPAAPKTETSEKVVPLEYKLDKKLTSDQLWHAWEIADKKYEEGTPLSADEKRLFGEPPVPAQVRASQEAQRQAKAKDEQLPPARESTDQLEQRYRALKDDLYKFYKQLEKLGYPEKLQDTTREMENWLSGAEFQLSDSNTKGVDPAVLQFDIDQAIRERAKIREAIREEKGIAPLKAVSAQEPDFVTGDILGAPEPGSRRGQLPSASAHPVHTEIWGEDAPIVGTNTAPHIPDVETAPPGEGGKKGPVSPTEVIDLAAKAVALTGAKVPIREATAKGPRAKKYAGWYEIRPEVIRTKVANNIPTVLHEVAHAIDFNLWGYKNPFVKGRTKVFLQELAQLGKDLYGSETPTAGYRREGWAEFIKFWGTGKDEVLKEKAPNVFKWFNETFKKENPDIYRALEKTRERAIDYYAQSDADRIQAHIVETKSWLDRARELISPEFRAGLKKTFVKDWIEQGEPFRYMEQQALLSLERTLVKPGGEKMLNKLGLPLKFGEEGAELSLSQQPYKLYDSFRMTVNDRVATMAKDGMIDIAGNRIENGPSLKDAGNILKKGKIPKETFSAYLYAKRAMALLLDKSKGPRNPGIPFETASRFISQIEAEHPDIGLAASKIYEWQDGVLNYMAQASPEYASTVARIRDADPGFYIPLQREFKKIDDLLSRHGELVTDPAVFRRLVGSGRRILNPLETILNNSRAMVASAHKRMVLDAVVELSKVPGMGHLITEIPRNQLPVANKSLADLMTTLEQGLRKAGHENAEVKVLTAPEEEGGFQLDKEDLSTDFATIFAPAVKAPKGEVSHFVVRKDGKPHFYEINSQLHEALAGMDPYMLSKSAGFWNSFLGPIEQAWGKTFRLGTTVLNPGFALYSNLTRDFQTYFTQTQQKGAGQILAMYGKALANGAMDAFIHKAESRDAYFDLAKRLGVERSNFLGGDFRRIERASREIFGGRTAIDVPLNHIGLFAELLSTPEKATRTAEIEGLMKEQGIKPGDNLTLEQATDLMLAYKQVTTDFTAGGRLARAVNSVNPFFNAAIQGPRGLLRAAERNPARVGVVMLGMAGLAAANWYKNKDEDWWKELPDDARYLFTWIPFENPMTGNKELLKIPRAYEAQGISMAMTEALLDAFHKEDPKFVTGWLNSFFKISSPVSVDPAAPLNEELAMNMPVMTRTLVQEWMNRDIFWHQNIVPRNLENAPPELQFNEYTSDVAKLTGKMLGISPMKVDFAIRSLAGGAPMQIVEWGEIIAEGREKNPTRFRSFTGNDTVDSLLFPFIDRALAREGQGTTGRRSTDEFYEKTLREAEYAWQTEGGPKNEKLYHMAQDAQKSLAALRDLRRNAHTPEDRDIINKKIISIARRTNKAWDSRNVAAAAPLRSERRTLQNQVKPQREKKKRERAAGIAQP